MCSVLLTKHYSGDQIKNEMGRACGMYGGQERCKQDFGGEFGRKRDNSETKAWMAGLY